MNTRSLSFLLFFVLTFVSGFCQDHVKELKKAKRFNSEKSLCRFLDNWHSLSLPVSSSEIENFSEIHRDVYSIFYDFYNPFELKRTGGDEIDMKLDTNTDYLVVQNKIFFYKLHSKNLSLSYFNRTGSNSFTFDSIIDFRPDLNIPGIKILYLTDDYKNDIYKFLEKKKPSYRGSGKNALTGVPQMKFYKTGRLNFLNKKLLIIDRYGTWDLHLVTQLEVNTIRFNQDYTQAILYYRYGHQLGEAVYEKKDGNWIFKTSLLNGWEGSTY